MSFLLYLLILSPLPYLSTSSNMYGIIRNASIKIPFDMNNEIGFTEEVHSCDNCLCTAFSDSRVYILTCTENQSKNFLCKFYYFMIKRDEIEYPVNGTNIYLIKNETFEEKDDCCNTTFLINKINQAKTSKSKSAGNNNLRSLVPLDDNKTLAAISSDKKTLLLFDKSTLEIVNISLLEPEGIMSIGYYNGKYYLGSTNIVIYDQNLNRMSDPINIGETVLSIRFNKEYMFVGTKNLGVLIFERDSNGTFTNPIPNPKISVGKEMHGIGIVNESAFYSGWANIDNKLSLYVLDGNRTWKESENDRIDIGQPTYDIFIDDCKRVWAVIGDTKKIIIYDQNKTHLGNITVDEKVFNLVILENYTLFISHEGGTIGLTRIQPSVNCRLPSLRKKH